MVFKVLVIEDEEEIREIVVKYMEKEGYRVMGAKDGIEGLGTFNEFQPHLVILDVMMPGIDGFDVLKEMRLISEVPVIMLTARQEEVDRLKGFDLGVDDYVLKPFSPKELVKRAQVIIKRSYSLVQEKKRLIVKPFELDLLQQKLFKSNKEIVVTAKEFQILKTFMSSPGQLFSREQLIESAFGYAYDGFDRNIDSYIKKIRQKIEEDSRKPKYLKTKYGAGYIFGGDDNEC